MKTIITLSLLALIATGCGGGGDGVTNPSTVSGTTSNRVPSVAGNYTGATTITYPEIPQTVSCNTTTSVTQNGSTVSIAPLQLSSGSCGGLSIPLGSTTIDAAGSLVNETGTYSDPSCGTYTYTVSGGFFGKDLRISWIGTSRTCYNANITVNLTRP